MRSRPCARCLNQPRAICDRPALCTHRKRTALARAALMFNSPFTRGRRVRGGRRLRSRGRRDQELGEDDGGERAEDLDHDERGRRRRLDPCEGVAERACDRDGWVREGCRRGEPIGSRDVAADRERRDRRATGSDDTEDHQEQAERGDELAQPEPADDRAGVVEVLTASSPNMRLATIALRCSRRRPARPRRRSPRRCRDPPRRRSASVTTGLKCAPDTGAEGKDQRDQPAPVAVEFSNSWSPRSFGERRWASIPEPITIATSSAVPSASAVA